MEEDESPRPPPSLVQSSIIQPGAARQAPPLLPLMMHIPLSSLRVHRGLTHTHTPSPQVHTVLIIKDHPLLLPSSLILTHTLENGEKRNGKGKKRRRKTPRNTGDPKKKLQYQIRRNRRDSSATTWHKHRTAEQRTGQMC